MGNATTPEKQQPAPSHEEDDIWTDFENHTKSTTNID